mmetsp:Transcript_102853/g.329960  ORF Transcript_102853/g.329960 Transcript_102853/m.329960 type:complete len:307 (-) Transcript_102853:148-1068(-)
MMHGRGHASGEHGELRGMLLLREAPHDADGLEVQQVRARGEAGEQAGLREGELAEGRGCLLDDLLGLRYGRQLLATALGLCLEVLGLGQALVVQRPLGLHIGGQLLGGRIKVTLGAGLLLRGRSDLLLRLVHLLGRELDLVLQTLLQHVEILHGRSLLLAEVVELRICLVRQALQGLQDVAAVALIRRHRRSTQGLGKFIAAVIGRRRLLHERRELRGIRRADQRGMHHDVQGLDQVVRTIELHECGATLVHLTLDDAGGARDRVDGLHEFLLLRLEILLFLLTDLLCTCEVSLVRADGGNKILDL